MKKYKSIRFVIRKDNEYMREYLKGHYAKNKEMYRAKQKRWLIKNPNYYRQYYQSHKNLKL